ncbi:hypothetical protein EDB81DRAFT_859671 [Dactylonectria macrodidyma]|uniref:Uncharacterized protein n=1 Tax=Dactylonectria macrodidyma TaxID=307937 RepID=A0A9P9E4R5_9HYPO|nr:hypothetical protein EDB81DRAFT_859671 [Dactylonectria macrodidyma]
MELSTCVRQTPASTSRAAKAAPAPELVFVTVTHPNEIKSRDTQRKISRHVMKEIGISRRRRPRDDHVVANSASEIPTTAIRSDQVVNRNLHRSRHKPNIHTQQSTDLTLSRPRSTRPTFPITDSALISPYISARARRLISFLQRDDSPICQMFRTLCFTLAMEDDSTMYLALAESALYVGQQSQNALPYENAHALEHYTASLGLLNRRLRAVLSVAGTPLLGTVIFLAGYDLRVHNFTRWAMHMSAIRGMLEYRGGIQTIKSYHLRMILVWKRSDVIGSLALDTMPSFPLHEAIMDQVEGHPMSSVLSISISALMRDFATLWDICPLLESLSSLTALASKKQPTYWYKDTQLTHSFTRFVHAMLTVPRYTIPDAEDPLAPGLAMREILRLGSLVFITSPVNHLASNRDFKTPHGGRLRQLLNSSTLDWSGLEHLELWVLVVSVVADGEDDESKSDIVSRIQSIKRTQGLNWHGVLEVLRAIAWIDSVFSEEVDMLEDRLKHTELLFGN